MQYLFPDNIDYSPHGSALTLSSVIMLGLALVSLVTAPLLPLVMGVDSPLEIIDKTITDNINRVNDNIQNFKGIKELCDWLVI